MLEQEAREKAISIIEDRRRVFCPMIKERCTVSCECYNIPTIRNLWYPQDAPAEEQRSWSVSGGYCTCHLLKGSSD